MSQLTKMIDELTTPDPAPSQPITGIPVRQRRRHKEDSITITLGWMCILLTVSVVVVQVGKWMGW